MHSLTSVLDEVLSLMLRLLDSRVKRTGCSLVGPRNTAQYVPLLGIEHRLLGRPALSVIIVGTQLFLG